MDVASPLEVERIYHQYWADFKNFRRTATAQVFDVEVCQAPSSEYIEQMTRQLDRGQSTDVSEKLTTPGSRTDHVLDSATNENQPR
jgi:predicted DNA-binding protein (UPF0278 family)